MPIRLQVFDQRIQRRPHTVVVVLPLSLEPPVRVIQRCMNQGADAGLHRAAKDVVFWIVVGCLGIFVHVQSGKAFGAAQVLGYGRISQAEIVEPHVALALVVPFAGAGRTQIVVLVVNLRFKARMLPADETAGRMPLLQRELQHPFAGPHGVKQTPVGCALVEIVDIVGIIERTAFFRVPVDHRFDGILHELDQMAFEKSPARWRTDLCRFDLDQAGQIDRCCVSCHVFAPIAILWAH